MKQILARVNSRLSVTSAMDGNEAGKLVETLFKKNGIKAKFVPD